jgi:NAD(P)-dependent dehydrogenase (short-subunit alcohol dehydrogenase family)
MRLKNKIAIVTGAASGIGEAAADLFIKEGAKVVYSDIHETPENLNLIEDQSLYIKCDVSKSEEVKNLIEKTVEKFGSLDVMVNNAGVGGLGGVLEASDEDFDKTIKINLYGVFYGSKLAANKMKELGVKGSIINISSILGTVGLPQAVAYCTSKGGVVQLTHASALDLSPHEIRINAVAPGFIKTGMTDGVLKDDNFNNMVLSNTPLGKVGEPIDIANAILYLASDESKYVTGTVLHVDGGWTAR